MPNTKSAKRKVKKVAKQAIINKFWKRRYKLATKKMEAVLKKNDKTKINYIGWRHQKADILIGDNTKLKNLINFRISKTIL